MACYLDQQLVADGDDLLVHRIGHTHHRIAYCVCESKNAPAIAPDYSFFF